MYAFRCSMVLLLTSAVSLATVTAEASPTESQVYVTAYCTTDLRGKPAADSGAPSVTLYDQRYVARSPSSYLKPAIRVLERGAGVIRFAFAAAPGNYDAFMQFPSVACGRNGPLVVVQGHDRHLFIAGSAIMDWHARLALAGSIPIDGLRVQAVTLKRPANCGDDPREYDDLDSDGLTDDGYYYANVMAYDKQDHTIALMISGALFTQGAILLTQPLGGTSHGRDLVIKNITPKLLRAVAATPNKFVCMPEF